MRLRDSSSALLLLDLRRSQRAPRRLSALLQTA